PRPERMSRNTLNRSKLLTCGRWRSALACGMARARYRFQSSRGTTMTLTAEAPSASTSDRSLSRAFYTTAWRWHFYAGLYVAPFLIMLAVTGLIMLWTSVLVG